MEPPPSVAEQRATAVAKLKRAASLPRMKDGRRPPMHVEAVSEGERGDKQDEESALESDNGKVESAEPGEINQAENAIGGSEDGGGVSQVVQEVEQEGPEDKTDLPPGDPSPERSTTPGRKRRSRSRARSRGSKDLRNKMKTPPAVSTNTNESSADEADERDAPPSPPVVSPTPHLAAFQSSRLLRSPAGLGSPLPMFYPGTSPSTPMIPTLDEIQKGIGLFRSNSVGAARMMAMQKLTGGTEPVDMSFGSSSPVSLARNNTVAGGERMAARRNLLKALGGRVEKVDTDVTSGEELARPVTPGTAKKKRRRSKRNSSRVSSPAPFDDLADEQPIPSTSTLPPPAFSLSPVPLRPVRKTESPFAVPVERRRTPASQQANDDTTSPMGGRGPVVEEEDDDVDRLQTEQRHNNGLRTPARRPGRLPHSTDAPSTASAESSTGATVPTFIVRSDSHGYKQDIFPASPFATPLREKPYGDEDDQSDPDQDSHLRAPATSKPADRTSELSWVADPVPALRMPVYDEDEDDEDDEEGETDADPNTSKDWSQPVGEHSESLPEPESVPSHSVYRASKNLVIEIETSPELSPANAPPSPLSPITLSPPTAESQAESLPPSPMYPKRLSMATPVKQLEHFSPAPEFEWDESRIESTPKRGGDNPSPWERLKNTLKRTDSTTGRRSRTNSFSRRYNTDSSISRESGISQSSGKAEKGDRTSVGMQQQSPSLVQSPSASGSILSLAPPSTSQGGSSPVPPASAGDAKYTDPKLFPFPGMKQLEEQRNRTKGILPSSSSPDIFSPPGIEAIASTSSSSSTTTKLPQGTREGKLSHQASDSRLLAKFTSLNTAPVIHSPGSQTDYFNLPAPITPPPASAGTGSFKLPLPKDREGVKKWLRAKNIFSSQSSAPPTPAVVSPPTRSAQKKPSLSDLLVVSRKENESSSDWEELSYDKARTPTSAVTPSSAKPHVDEHKPSDVRVKSPEPPSQAHQPQAATQSSLGVPELNARENGIREFLAFPSPPEPPSSTTPDPQSSLDEYTGQSTTESVSSRVSSSPNSPEIATTEPSRAAVMLERLEEALGRGSKSSFWPFAIDDPPRKLVFRSPVLQVVNANTVKDRFLFLFNDILVIAKPLPQEHDSAPMDRKFTVKSVVLLRELRFSAEREESRTKASACAGPNRHPVIRNFVHQFSKDPDHAITSLFSKSNTRDDPIALGQLLFRTTDLDRVRLGEYLSRRTSKVVLKAYLDSFGFAGLRIDKALRVFLLSMWIPNGSLDYLIEWLSTRWYEANKGVVAYDRDLAGRLIRAIVHLNEAMHGGIAQTPGLTGYPKRNIISRDFVEAFRRYDSRGLVSDDLLDKIYAAIRRERLSQSRNLATEPPVNGAPPHVSLISVKRPLPPRLTYRVQSEPVVLRIPAPDPHLTIQLFGQDLVFDPPFLTFAKSAEASFRITGTSLGPKTIIMWLSGPNAIAYTGLPLSSPLMVERAFMRNTFQVAFLDRTGIKRKYMFSVEDPVLRQTWTDGIKHAIEQTSASPASSVLPHSPGTAPALQKALENVGFQVLQDTLIGPVEDHVEFPSAVDSALARLTGTASPEVHGHNIRQPESAAHARSKSRSQVYHKYGAGSLEPDMDDERGFGSDDMLSRQQSHRPEDRVWSGHDLEVVCRQNSSLASVLTYLRVDNDVEYGVYVAS